MNKNDQPEKDGQELREEFYAKFPRGKFYDKIPSRKELIALFMGTHTSCQNKPFTLKKIAKYYTKKYRLMVSPDRVKRWFQFYQINLKDLRSQRYPIPSKEQLIALYNGTHEACCGRPFSLRKIAEFYTTEYNRKVSERRVTLWFDVKKIKRRCPGELYPPIPTPKKEELIALYEGTHEACCGRPFSLLDILTYYKKKFNQLFSVTIVVGWFENYKIPRRDPSFTREIPIPKKEELIALYKGTHEACCGRPFSLRKIAKHYSKKYDRAVGDRTVLQWFRILEIERRDPVSHSDGKDWEMLFYDIAETKLKEKWTIGHGENHILSPNIPGRNYLEPEIFIPWEEEHRVKRKEFKKFIDAKTSDTAVSYKDTFIYPQFAFIVEFWCLSGESRVELHYQDRIDFLALNEFNENDYINKDIIEKVLIYRNSNDLIQELQQEITEENRNAVLDLIRRIKLLQQGYSLLTKECARKTQRKRRRSGKYLGKSGLELAMRQLRELERELDRLPTVRMVKRKLRSLLGAIERGEWELYGIRTCNDLIMKTFGRVNNIPKEKTQRKRRRSGKYLGKSGLELAMRQLRELERELGRLPTIEMVRKKFGGIYSALYRGEWLAYGIQSFPDFLKKAFSEYNSI